MGPGLSILIKMAQIRRTKDQKGKDNVTKIKSNARFKIIDLKSDPYVFNFKV
jgi:hypothetical protein